LSAEPLLEFDELPATRVGELALPGIELLVDLLELEADLDDVDVLLAGEPVREERRRVVSDLDVPVGDRELPLLTAHVARHEPRPKGRNQRQMTRQNAELAGDARRGNVAHPFAESNPGGRHNLELNILGHACPRLRRSLLTRRLGLHLVDAAD